MLRAGYVAFGVAFLALAAAAYASGELVLLALAAGLAGGLLLALSKDDLPKGAGIAMLAYFALTVLAFAASTPITFGRGYFVNDKPSAMFADVYYYVVLAYPIMLAATALAASWERELGPRALLACALAGSALWAVLNYVLVPHGSEAQVETANALLQGLAALSALVGAAGAAWATLRPDEYA
jgi:hypothetical protein